MAIVRVARKDAKGPALDHVTWAALHERLGGVGQITWSGAFLLAIDQGADDGVSAVEAALDAIPALAGWRDTLFVATA